MHEAARVLATTQVTGTHGTATRAVTPLRSPAVPPPPLVTVTGLLVTIRASECPFTAQGLGLAQPPSPTPDIAVTAKREPVTRRRRPFVLRETFRGIASSAEILCLPGCPSLLRLRVRANGAVTATPPLKAAQRLPPYVPRATETRRTQPYVVAAREGTPPRALPPFHPASGGATAEALPTVPPVPAISPCRRARTPLQGAGVHPLAHVHRWSSPTMLRIAASPAASGLAGPMGEAVVPRPPSPAQLSPLPMKRVS